MISKTLLQIFPSLLWLVNNKRTISLTLGF